MDEAAVNMVYHDGITAEISNTNCISTAKLQTLLFTVLFLSHPGYCISFSLLSFEISVSSSRPVK